jgi:hypothetical protein
MSMDMRKFIANKPDSLFMDAFATDCILILKHMKFKYPVDPAAKSNSKGFDLSKMGSTAGSHNFPMISSNKSV